MAPWHQAGTPGMAQVVGIQHLSLLAGLGCAFGFLEGRGVGGQPHRTATPPAQPLTSRAPSGPPASPQALVFIQNIGVLCHTWYSQGLAQE